MTYTSSLPAVATLSTPLFPLINIVTTATAVSNGSTTVFSLARHSGYHAVDGEQQYTVEVVCRDTATVNVGISPSPTPVQGA
jgi:hypothetical protein